MDLVEEYGEFNEIPRNIAITYKFFDLFKVSSSGSLSWGKEKCVLDGDVLDVIKTFLKTTKSGLRNNEYNASECGKRMVFFYYKLVEFGAFDSSVRMEILKFMDVCQWIIT